MRRAFTAAMVAVLVGVGAAIGVASPAMAAAPAYQLGGQLTLPGSGSGVAVDGDRGLIYVAGRFSGQVWIYDEATLTLQATVPVPNEPYNLAIGPAGHVYVTQYTGNTLQGSVSVIDPDTRSVVSTSPTGNAPVGVTVSRDGTRLWVGNGGGSTFISVFDLTDPAVPVALAPIAVAVATELVTEGPGGLLYVSTRSNSVIVVDQASGAVVSTWTGMSSAHQVVISSDDTKAFVSAQQVSNVPVVDLATNTASGSIALANAYYQSTDPALGVGFITAPFLAQGSIGVIDLATGALAQTVGGVSAAYYVATSTSTHRTYATGLASTKLTIVVPSPPAVTTSPLSQTVAIGDPVTFTAAATSAAPLTVQWQQSTDGGATWSDVEGATSDSHQIPATALEDSGLRVRAVFTNLGGAVTTGWALLSVVVPPPVVTTDPVDQTVLVGESAAFTASATSPVPMTVQWQMSTDGGGTWGGIAGANETTYATTATSTSESGTLVRAEFSNAGGSTTSAPAVLTVELPPPPVVTTDPADQSVLKGADATFSASATSPVAMTRQWQVSDDHGATWTSITGETASTLTLHATITAQSGAEFRLVFTNAGGSVETLAATLTVTAVEPPAPDVAPGGLIATGGVGIPWWIAVLALLVLVVGGLLIRAARATR